MSRANPATTHDNAGIAAWRFKLEAEIGSYEDCATFLQGDDESAMAVTERQLGPQMYVERRLDEGYIAVRLYDTEIIRYYPDGTFSVDNGGYRTPTTTYRLCAVLPEGYVAHHHQKQLMLRRQEPDGNWPWPGQLWPLDHSKRIKIETGEIV